MKFASFLSVLTFLYISCILVKAQQCPSDYSDHPLVVVSMDGFRFDYLQRGLTPNINAFQRAGVSASYMKASYPTLTFPNHYTIATGLYPESHGIIANSFYDPNFDEYFYLGDANTLEGKWWGGSPIWNTVVKQGKLSATYFWPGSDAFIEDMHPSFYYPYDGSVPFQDRIDKLQMDSKENHAERSEIFENSVEKISVAANFKVQESKSDSPDGGWGWAVVFGTMIVLNASLMMAPTFGIMFSTMLRANKVSSTTVSWIFNMFTLIWNATQLFAGPLTDVLSWRSVAMFGSFVTVSSILSSAFATSPTFLFLTFSLLGGIGTGLSIAVCFLITPKYFNKRRGIAMSVMILGSSLGHFLCPITISYLQETYGYFGATLLVGGIAMQMFVGSSLFIPLSATMPKSSQPKKDFRNQMSTEDIELIEKKIFNVKPTNEEKHLSRGSSCGSIKALVGAVAKLTWSNLTMIKSFRAIILATGITTGFIGFYNFNMLIAFSLQNEGYTLEEAAWCTSASGLGNFIGRLLVVLANIWTKFNTRLGFLFAKICLIIGTLGFALTTSFSLSFTFVSMVGFGFGIVVPLYPLVIIEVMDISFYPRTYGFSAVFIAFGSVTMGPLVGLVRDYTRSYKVSIMVITGILTISSILWLFLPCASQYDEKRNMKSKSSQESIT